MGDMSDNTGNEGREVPSTYLVSQQVSSQSVLYYAEFFPRSARI